MSLLKSLKLSSVRRSAQPISPTERGRDKLRAYLDEQRQLATALAQGTTYAPTRTVTTTDEAGNKVKVEKPRSIRRGWFTGGDGKLFFQLRYGGRALELAKGMNAVEVENLAALPEVLDTLDSAVQAGEFDAVVAAAAQSRAATMKAKTKKAS